MIVLSAVALLAAIGLWSGVEPRFGGAPRTARGVTDEHEPAEFILDLAANLLDSGLPPRSVLLHLARTVPGCRSLTTVAYCLQVNMAWSAAWSDVEPWLRPLERTLHFTELSGAPSAELIRQTALLRRREKARNAQMLGAEFGTRLVLPLGLCALPAFIALGIVPLIVAMLPSW